MRTIAPNGLARAAVRFKPASFVGTFVALMMSALIVMACGILLETGARATAPAVRYANAPVVVAAEQSARIVADTIDGPEETVTTLPDTARVDAALAEQAARVPGVATAVPDFTFPVRQGDQLVAGHGWGSHAFTGEVLSDGAAPDAGEVVLDTATAYAATIGVGDTVTLETADGPAGFRVSGLAPAADGASATAWFADTEAPTLAGHPGKADAIAVLPADRTDTGALASVVAEALTGSGAQVLTGDARGAVENRGLAYARETLTAIGGSFGAIATLVAVFTAAGTVALSVGQRTREFALLRAVGATPRQVRRAVATEALLVAPLAALVGCLPGVALAAWWFGRLKDHGAVPEAVDLHVSVLPLLAAVAIGLLTALGAGWAAGRRPAMIKPGQALAEAAVERRRQGLVRTVLGFVAIGGGTAMAGVAASSAGSDAAGASLGVVMLFMLAIALLGPLVARWCASIFALLLRHGDAPASLAAANSRTNSRRLASAITPIVLAMAFASTLVFMHTSESRVAAEHLRDGITADHVVTNAAGLPGDAADRAAAMPGVETAVSLLDAQVLVPVTAAGETSWQRWPAQGISGSGRELARVQDLDVPSGSLDRVGPDRIAIDRTLAGAAHVDVGDDLSLRLPDGTEATAEVVAVYARGLGLPAVTMDRDSLAGHVTSAFDATLLVNGGDAESLAPIGEVTDPSGHAARQNVERELGAWMNDVMAAILGGFAAVAAANTLVMTVLERRRELTMLRLVGSTRRQVLRMLHWESLLVSAAGVALGTAIAMITLTPMMRGMTGQAPHVPPLLYGGFVGAAVILGLLAVTLPGRAALRDRRP